MRNIERIIHRTFSVVTRIGIALFNEKISSGRKTGPKAKRAADVPVYGVPKMLVPEL